MKPLCIVFHLPCLAKRKGRGSGASFGQRYENTNVSKQNQTSFVSSQGGRGVELGTKAVQTPRNKNKTTNSSGWGGGWLQTLTAGVAKKTLKIVHLLVTR